MRARHRFGRASFRLAGNSVYGVGASVPAHRVAAHRVAAHRVGDRQNGPSRLRLGAWVDPSVLDYVDESPLKRR
jgi:hypothetical protein